jgi:hypothetical protein
LNEHVRNDRRAELLLSVREYFIITTYHQEHQSPSYLSQHSLSVAIVLFKHSISVAGKESNLVCYCVCYVCAHRKNL